jgi:hypothetical protein
VAFSLFACPPLKAQINQSTLVHMDKPYYVAGETIFYKLYFPEVFRNRSPMLEMQVYNGTGVLVHKNYVKKDKKNYVHGFYRIPFEAEAGVYNLVVVSLVEKSKLLKVVSEIPFSVYNDSQLETIVSEENAIHFPTMDDLKSELSIVLKLGKDQYHTREQVALVIDIRDLQGNKVPANLSLSVTDIGIIGSQQSHSHLSLHQVQLSYEPSGYLSEYIPISGQLENQKEQQLITFFMPSLNRIFYTTSESDGNFQLLIPGFYGEQSLQYIGEFSDGARMKLNHTGRFHSSAELVYSASIIKYLQASRNRKLIYQLYNKVEGVNNYQIPKAFEVAIPDREFKAANYPFEDLPRFCKEISTPLKYDKDKEGGFEFKMINPESKRFYFGNPLFIVDGQMTKDATFLAKVDFQEIDKINLYYDNQRLSDNFGFAGFSGVVIISSKEGSLKVPQVPLTQEFQVSGLQLLISNSTEDMDAHPEEPIFKPQLLWKPTLQTNFDGHLELTYRQSDDISKFKIEVVAQTKDGRRGNTHLIYRVH